MAPMGIGGGWKSILPNGENETNLEEITLPINTLSMDQLTAYFQTNLYSYHLSHGRNHSSQSHILDTLNDASTSPGVIPSK